MSSKIPFKQLLPTSLLVILAFSCITGSDDSQQSFDGIWKINGLSNITVNNFSLFEGSIFASTDKGMYIKSLESGKVSWNSVGLQEKEVLDLVFLRSDKLLAALQISYFSEGIPSLFLSSDNGQSWQPHMSNYGGETGEYTWVGAIDTPSNPSDTVFTRVGGTTIARTINSGESWKVVNGDWNYWGGAAVLVKADPYHNQRVWAGGVNAYSFPYLLKSTDGGETWENLKTIMSSSQVCYDVISHPEDKNLVIAGMFGTIDSGLVIRKSTDAGKTWVTVYEGIGTLTMANSVRNAEIVYASGRNIDGTLFFVASNDFGDTWEIIEMEDSPNGIEVNDMVSVMVEGREVLYLGTNKGVYSYTFKE